MKRLPLNDSERPRVYAWAEENEGSDPLADAYMSICGCIGNVDVDALEDRIEEFKPRPDWFLPQSVMNDIIKVRDRIGRVILRRVLDAEIKSPCP